MSTSIVYNSARQAFAAGTIDWATATVKAALVNGAYGPLPTDQYLSAVPTGAIMVSAQMTGLGSKNGVCYGAIPQFDAFESASIVVGLLLYIDSGNPATSQLIYYSDEGVGFPFQPEGFNYAVAFDQSAGGFFQV